jgi:hypothetical protein
VLSLTSRAVTAVLDYAGPTLDTVRDALAGVAGVAAIDLDVAWTAALGLAAESLGFDSRRGALVADELQSEGAGRDAWGRTLAACCPFVG